MEVVAIMEMQRQRILAVAAAVQEMLLIVQPSLAALVAQES